MGARDVLDLTDERATEPALAGGKAAALARALAAGLPALPGFVLTTGDDDVDRDRLRRRWQQLSRDGARSLVVRSSGVTEDAATSSLAGRYRTELDVRGWDAFDDAVDAVLDSAAGEREQMAVLVQPFAPAEVGGIAFASDPATGRRRLTVAAVAGGPDRLVSGEETGSYFHVGRTGATGAAAGLLTRGQGRQLRRLVASAGRLFGAPQDVEWAVVDGELVLFQSRPVTTAGSPRGRVLGPGPVAETFPEPVAPLEADLWVEPLRRALTEAVVLSGTASRTRAETNPIVDVVDGWVVADLALVNATPQARRRSLINPVAGFRQLRTSWRVGRLRPALPGLARDTVQRTDVLLAEVPALTGLTERDLVTLLVRCVQALTAVHGHEVLMGTLLRDESVGGSALQGAVRLAVAARAEGLDDESAVARDPAVLALTQARICRTVRLPAELPDLAAPDPPAAGADGEHAADQNVQLLREALRLRVRWLQELGARAAAELGERLARADVFADWAEIRTCRLADLLDWQRTGRLPAPHPDAEPERNSRPLPASFRLDRHRRVLPVQPGRSSRERLTDGDDRGLPASPGVVSGMAWHGDGDPPENAVLVVRTLSPALAVLLPRLAGLVAETGSPLAHLAILAREQRLPTVVAVPDAVVGYPDGTPVRVDGDRGTVRALSVAGSEPVPGSPPSTTAGGE